MTDNSEPSLLHRIAWQGMRLNVPPAWELGTIEGDERTGHCRIDEIGIARMDVRWKKGRRSSTARSVADAYIRQAGLNKRGVDLRRDVRLVNVPDMDTEFFVVRGEREAMHMAARCNVCGRVTIARVLYDPEEKCRASLKEIFGSYEDHPENGLIPWEVMGLAFEVPETFRLSGHVIEAGKLIFEFWGPDRAFRVARFALADIILKNQTLGEWVKTLGSPLKTTPISPERAEVEWAGHSPLHWYAREKCSFRRWFRRGRLLRASAWHCPESKTYITIQWVGHALDEANQLEKSVRCHLRSQEQSPVSGRD